MNVIKYPLSTEKSIRMMESENKLVFVVERTATKDEIKKELEDVFNVKIEKLNTTITPQGHKKAYVKFKEESAAINLATKLGLM